ncbi:efflux RND transporter periplasmic adaptor subunit [Acidobacteriota bacterium]
MRNLKYFSIIGIILILAFCAPPGNKQTQLDKLVASRDALNQQIEELKAEIGQEDGAAPQPAKTANVKAVAVGKELFQHFIQVQGTVESDNNIQVAPMSSGLVQKIHVSSGNRVKVGDLLAELDGSILESSIAEVEGGLKLAQTIFERQDRLWKQNIGSEIQYLQAKNNKESLEKRLTTLNEQYKLTKIYSPISGTVDEVIIKEGEMAAAGMPALRVVQLSNLKILVDLSEVYIARIKRGDLVQVILPVTGKELNLKIDAVSQVIDSDDRTFQIEIKIPRSETGIKPNMLAVLIINDYSNAEAVIVPTNIVQKTETQRFVFVAHKKDGGWIAEKRIVTTGETSSDFIEVLAGLDEGEYVVTLGFQNLADGQNLTVTLDEKSGTAQ